MGCNKGRPDYVNPAMQTNINMFRLLSFKEVLSSKLKKFFSHYSYVGDERRSPKYCVRIGAFFQLFFVCVCLLPGNMWDRGPVLAHVQPSVCFLDEG